MRYLAIIEDFAGIRHEVPFFCAAGVDVARSFAHALAAVRAARLAQRSVVTNSTKKTTRPLCRVVKLAVLEDGCLWHELDN